ncbi:MAG TPA: penicillin-binding transpeptidase domain-containing protein [Thermoleophilaceae bacterium]|nr:penicillin-binding transpeptidase domain-containing protein [Thermoleophilaceae bacterium]
MASHHAPERHRRVTHRALPLGALAAVALVGGLVVGSTFQSGSERVAESFAQAWERGDYGAMYRLLSASSQSRYPRADFQRAYENAGATSTAVEVRADDPDGTRDGAVRMPIAVRTRLFGTIRGEVALPVSGEAIQWEPGLAFPGLPEGGRLTRDTKAPRRSKILSADRLTLAEGPAGARSSPLDGVGASIAGGMAVPDEADGDDRTRSYARGFPADTPVGTSGLERALQLQVEGRPGGTLSAGDRVLARSEARPAGPVRSTIDTRVQAAAVTALAGRFGGIAAVEPKTGAILALAGVAFSAPQPPGSVFKLVTTTAALEARKVTPSKKFPVQTEAVIDGVPLSNANGEACGGTFKDSFANSCNSVFAPLGVEVGAKRLVATAERFGFNQPPTIAGALASTLPAAEDISGPLDLGSSAIGQGRVLATPLQMASVGQTIANNGVRLTPTLLRSSSPKRTRVTSARIANTVTRLMEGVVAYGTGTAAAVDGVRVAGKTGTAELADTRGPEADFDLSDPTNTDAWFTAFAPAGRPRIAVAVLLIRAGAGGAVAAPTAQGVLVAGLKR